MPRGRTSSPHQTTQRNQRRNAKSFRERFDALEAQRARLLARLQALGAAAQGHPAHRKVLHLLNPSFRKASLQQRVAVLQAADWLIGVLDRLTMTL